MKAKRVTVCFDYTNFDVLESMLDRLKDEITQGRELFASVPLCITYLVGFFNVDFYHSIILLCLDIGLYRDISVLDSRKSFGSCGLYF